MKGFFFIYIIINGGFVFIYIIMNGDSFFQRFFFIYYTGNKFVLLAYRTSLKNVRATSEAAASFF